MPPMAVETPCCVFCFGDARISASLPVWLLFPGGVSAADQEVLLHGFSCSRLMVALALPLLRALLHPSFEFAPSVTEAWNCGPSALCSARNALPAFLYFIQFFPLKRDHQPSVAPLQRHPQQRRALGAWNQCWASTAPTASTSVPSTSGTPGPAGNHGPANVGWFRHQVPRKAGTVVLSR